MTDNEILTLYFKRDPEAIFLYKPEVRQALL